MLLSSHHRLARLRDDLSLRLLNATKRCLFLYGAVNLIIVMLGSLVTVDSGHWEDYVLASGGQHGAVESPQVLLDRVVPDLRQPLAHLE